MPISFFSICIPRIRRFSGFTPLLLPPKMVPDLPRPQITEIHVRMDCNGCVQKIKRALNGINGIYDLYIDFPQQKLTVIGWADPERIIKAIKKVRKIATICSHTEAPDPNAQPTETPQDGGAPPPEGAAPGPDAGNPPPHEPPRSEEPPPPPPQEPPSDQQPQPQQPPGENPPAQDPPPETNPAPPATDQQPSQPAEPSKPKDVEEVHVVYHHPPDYGHRYGHDGYGPGPGYSHGYGGYWASHPGPSYIHEPPPRRVYHEPSHQPAYHEPPHQPVYHEPPPRPVYHEPPPRPVHVMHSYNTYRPSPYVTEYEYVRSPPRYTSYGRTDHYNMDPYGNGGASNGNVTSMFSDENPNACTIV